MTGVMVYWGVAKIIGEVFCRKALPSVLAGNIKGVGGDVATFN